MNYFEKKYSETKFRYLLLTQKNRSGEFLFYEPASWSDYVIRSYGSKK